MKHLKRNSWILATLLASPLVSAQDTVLYDDFKHKLINPAKWESGIGLAGATEIVRKIEGSKLRMDLRGFADDTRDTGKNSIRNSLYLPEEIAAKVSKIEVDVAVKDGAVLGCKANKSSSKARFRLVGYWFRNGDAHGSKDRTGNVWAQIWIRASEQALKPGKTKVSGKQAYDVTANVYVCGNAACSRGRSVFTKRLESTQDSKKKKLSITWNELSNQFVFKSDRRAVTYNYSKDLVNAGAPNFAYFKGLQVATDIENCNLGKRPIPRRPFGFLSAKVDNVRLNTDYNRNW